MDRPFKDVRSAGRALLESAWHGETKLTWRSASFAGQASVADEPLSTRQLTWLGQLLERAGLPCLDEGVS